MTQWFRTPRQKFIAGFLFLMTALFGVMTFISLGDGTPAWSKVYSEAQFESESADDSLVGKLSVPEREVCMVKVNGLTLDQSWLWVKVMILDEQDRPVHNFDFNLSYYSGVEGGESWSEGDREDEKVFILPKGDYKVVVYGEDENPNSKQSASAGAALYSNGYTTIDRAEQLEVIITTGVLLTRYFLGLFLAFFALLALYVWRRSENAKHEVPGYYDYGYDDEGHTYTPAQPSVGVGAPSGGAYDMTDQAPNQGFDPDIDPKRQG